MTRKSRQFPVGKFTLRTPRKTKNGQEYIIYIYYYWQGRQLRRSTDISVSKKDWNQNAINGVGELRSSYGSNYLQRNAFLHKLLRNIDSQIMEYVEKHGSISCEVIESFLDGSSDALRPDNGIDFVEFAKQRYRDRYQSGKIGVSSRENGISGSIKFSREGSPKLAFGAQTRAAFPIVTATEVNVRQKSDNLTILVSE